jgi:hypothetical protein
MMNGGKTIWLPFLTSDCTAENGPGIGGMIAEGKLNQNIAVQSRHRPSKNSAANSDCEMFGVKTR